MTEAKLLINFCSEINSKPIKHYSNQPKKNRKQSAVAIILRCSNPLEKELNLSSFEGPNNKINFFIPSKNKLNSLFQNFLEKDTKNIFEVLFVQRAITEKDLHSGEICFPGGKCDNDETDYEAVIREVKEEVDFDLMTNDNSMYLGKLPKNFYVYRSRSGYLYVSVHVFLLLNHENVSRNTKPNDREVAVMKWVPLQNFLTPKPESLVLKHIKPKLHWIRTYPKFIQGLFSKFLPNYDHAEYAGINIGMNEILYGLTFFMMVYVLWVIREGIREGDHSRKEVERILKFSDYNKMVFKKETALNRVGGWVGGYWYRTYRNKEFKYTPRRRHDRVVRCIYLICYLLVIFAIVRFFQII